MDTGLLTGSRCYLIGAMEYTSDGRGWREHTQDRFRGSGIIFFNPYHKPFLVDINEDEEARKSLKQKMQEGKYDEAQSHIVTATRAKKPIFLVVKGGKHKTPLWVMGMIPHKYIYSELDDALDMLEYIHIEQVIIDSDRWKLFKKEYLNYASGIGTRF